MYSIKKATEEFKGIYKQGVRKDFDLGELNYNSIVIEGCKSEYDYFINELNPKDEIHISIPFNLRLIKDRDNEVFKKGWDGLELLNNYWFFGNQNDNFLLLDIQNDSVHSINSGESEIIYQSASFADFIKLITEIMVCTNKYLEKHYEDDDFLVFDDELYMNEVNKLIDNTELEIIRDNFKYFFIE